MSVYNNILLSGMEIIFDFFMFYLVFVVIFFILEVYVIVFYYMDGSFILDVSLNNVFVF